ncbi:MAG: VCBS repeat-containing protein [Planctomycetes bacterium]|nr:VCBS repeat-containing protein [Planctomycetota bacterium]
MIRSSIFACARILAACATSFCWCGAQTPPPEFRFGFAPGAAALPTWSLDQSLSPSVVDPIAEGDIDRDGRTDFAVLEPFRERISYYLASGRGSFAGPFSAGSAIDPISCALVDLDRDAFPDLLVATSTGAFVARNERGQGFATPVELAGSAWDGRHGLLGAADVDRDGDRDVIVGKRLFLRRSQAWTFEADPEEPFRMVEGRAVLADLDDDGDPDLATPSTVYWNRGRKRFRASSSPSLQPTVRFVALRPPVIARWSGGAIPDLLFQDDRGELRFFVPGRRRTWVERTSLSAWPTPGFSGMRADDFDRDGRLDLLLSRNPGYVRDLPSLALMRNLGNGVFRDESASALPHAELAGGWVVVGDWSGDGAPEVLMLGSRRLYWNDGRGRLLLSPGPMLPMGLRQSLQAAVADLDGDGADEIVLARGDLLLLHNDGWGRFSALGANLPPPPDSSCFNALCIDLDGDGARDVIAACLGQSRFYRNVGQLQFRDETATRFPALPGATLEILAFDADGDGDQDLLQLNNGTNPYNGRRDRLLLNAGQGFFVPAPATSLPELPEPSVAGHAADLDHDGDCDLFLVGWDRERLLLNDGRGAFSIAPFSALPPPRAVASDVEAGDLDGDGDLDLYLLKPGRYTSDPNAPMEGGSDVYLNDGCGRFARLADAVEFASPTWSTSNLCLYDIDADGDLDAVEARRTDSRVLRNDGSARFARVLGSTSGLNQDFAPGPSWDVSSLHVGDWDRDQDADLLALYWNGNGFPAMPAVLQGMLRHLAIPKPPSLAGPLELVTVHEGPIASPATWIAYVSTERSAAGTAVPPFGTFGLASSGLNAWAPFPLLPGTRIVAVPLPRDPSLLRQMLHVQALFLPDVADSTWKLSAVVSTIVLP